MVGVGVAEDVVLYCRLVFVFAVELSLWTFRYEPFVGVLFLWTCLC